MTVREAPVTTTPVSASTARKWVRRLRIAADGRVDPGTVYSVVLALGMSLALFGRPVLHAVWPREDPSTPAAVALTGGGLVLLGLFFVLRQVGPLAVSRADATWLLPAPVSRRELMAPALLLTLAASLLVGAVTGLGLVGHIATRPAGAVTTTAGATTGAAAAVLVAALAVRCQREATFARTCDRAGAAVATVLLVLTAGVQLSGAAPGGLPTLPTGVVAMGVIALVAAAGAAAATAYRWLDTWPTHLIAEASVNLGAYADSVYAVEPSFLAELSTRRYWRRRPGVKSRPWGRHARVFPFLTLDLLLVRRKAGRLWFLMLLAVVPASVGDVPRWLLAALVLAGALWVAGTTAEYTHSDAANPTLLRLLGVTGRRVVAARLAVPGTTAALWTAVALGLLQLGGAFTGPWWLLGLAAAPAVAVASIRRAKASAASIGNVLVDTPLGAFPSGMLLWVANGIDVLVVLTLPLSIGLVTVDADGYLSWRWVLVQALLSVLGCVMLVRSSTGRNSRL